MYRIFRLIATYLLIAMAIFILLYETMNCCKECMISYRICTLCVKYMYFVWCDIVCIYIFMTYVTHGSVFIVTLYNGHPGACYKHAVIVLI